MSNIYPYPDDSSLPPISAPYIAKYSFDLTVPNGFQNFALRYGFMPTLGILDRPRSPEDLAALMQSWLFFGLIDEMVGHSIDHSTFLIKAMDKQGSTSLVVDLGLPVYLNETWVRALFTIDANHHAKTLTFAKRMCDEFDNTMVPSSISLGSISLSVRLLISYFQRTSSLGLEDPLPLRHSVALAPPSLALLLSRCRHTGMCIRSLYSIGSALDYPELYYLSSLRESPRAQYHALCTDSICQEDTEQRTSPVFVAQAYHRTDDCNCHKYGPSSDDVVKILRAGGLPLISMKPTMDGAIDFSVTTCTTSTNYVAISHVWSDNRLCSDSNQLHLCQLEYLNRRLSELASAPDSLGRPNSERLFWLDTLCIPSDESLSDLRKQSINEMDLVYAGADRVLVLDAELENITTATQVFTGLQRRDVVSFSSIMTTTLAPSYDDTLRVAAHILRSTWMTRSWTLQEGSLSRSCAIQLQSCTADLKYLDIWQYADPILSGQLPVAGWSPWFYPAVNIYALLRHMHLEGDTRLIVATDSFLKGLSLLLSILFNIACLPLLNPVLCFCSVPRRWPMIGYIPYNVSPRSQSAFELSHGAKSRQYVTMSYTLCLAVTSALRRASADIPETEKLKRTWQSLRGRSTTKPADIPCIIANLANLNAAEVLNRETNGE
jgi:hypothetical protein